ncbi:lysophospholipid acyltransferase family protein [Variovorax ginsengisoli]|uniref:1-acyl-sn-glycerol-3-phosphate acyltransferase n=1 Tax=Variovorax ginsengisoli TaxID=363844 RepID=A0ABT9SBZ9_9BURK|nr:lysophospholipid acyltransferase family protein [Variovorax ginsengisoli]MDP9901874.1 1-acyl-sn-glycerol-3-phosphate acyltransferase [Variovorax ginsengisoli]
MTAKVGRCLRAAGSMLRAVPLYAMLVLLGLTSLAWNVIAMTLHPVMPAAHARTVGRAAIAFAYRSFWAIASFTGMMRIDAACMDALRSERGLIVVANHPTMLDALLLVARLPRSACIMKADLMRNVFIGAGARLAHYICNDSPRRMIKLAVEDLRQGGQLVLFPEGTRTVRAPINAFRPGVTLIAKMAQVPIQTVFIETNTRYLSKGWPLWRVPALPLVFTLRLGQRFAPSQDSDALLRQLEQYFRHQMEQSATEAPLACQTPRAPTLS